MISKPLGFKLSTRIEHLLYCDIYVGWFLCQIQCHSDNIWLWSTWKRVPKQVMCFQAILLIPCYSFGHVHACVRSYLQLHPMAMVSWFPAFLAMVNWIPAFLGLSVSEQLNTWVFSMEGTGRMKRLSVHSSTMNSISIWCCPYCLSELALGRPRISGSLCRFTCLCWVE